MLAMLKFAGGIVNGTAVDGPVFLFYDPGSSGVPEMIKVSGNNLSLAINTRLVHTAKLKKLRRTQQSSPPMASAAVTDDETDGATAGREDNGEETFRVLRLAAFDSCCMQLRLLPHRKAEVEAFLEHVKRAKGVHVPAMPADDRIVREDLRRMGVVSDGSAWRVSTVNAGFGVCPTYPQVWAVPRGISDSVLKHAAAFRVKHRLPILAFVQPASGAAIVRSGQPLVGLWRRRSVQDEHLVDAIRKSTGTGDTGELMIVDARPAVNAIANAITGAGFEPLDNYAGCSRHFVHIENVHAIRAAYVALLGGQPAEWVGHARRILEATRRIIEGAFITERRSVLVHCSDGWDRTSQLISLAKVCLDPFYRTIRGLLALVYCDWIAAGHRFADRLGHRLPLNSLAIKPMCHLQGTHHHHDHHSSNVGEFIASHLRLGASPEAEEFSPIFPQFLECLGQLVLQHPSAFEYGLAGLRALALEAMANDTGLFGANCEAERLLLMGGSSSSSAGRRSQSIEAVWESLCIPRPPLETADHDHRAEDVCHGIIIPKPLGENTHFTSILLLLLPQ